MGSEQNRRLLRREERISRQQQARRQEILDVAREILSRDGISRFQMEVVAEEGGYSRTSIYRYFSSKEDLIADLAIESLELRIDLYRRVVRWDAKPREREVALGEVSTVLYPRHIAAEVFAATTAVHRGTTPERRRRMLELEREQEGLVLEVAREAVDGGDWELPADLTLEEALFGISAMTRGLFERLRSPLPPHRIRDPRRLQRSMGSRLLDSLGWRPLSTEWDYAATMRRIHHELFPRELRAALGLPEDPPLLAADDPPVAAPAATKRARSRR
jgi:AcrR family transcriptional regulator